MEMDSNPTYKRCHLCVRIFSTKANLRYPLIFYFSLFYNIILSASELQDMPKPCGGFSRCSQVILFTSDMYISLNLKKVCLSYLSNPEWVSVFSYHILKIYFVCTQIKVLYCWIYISYMHCILFIPGVRFCFV